MQVTINYAQAFFSPRTFNHL